MLSLAFTVDMSTENQDITKAIDDLKRKLRAELRMLKDSAKNCNDTCDGVNEIETEMEELRKGIQNLSRRNEELAAEKS